LSPSAKEMRKREKEEREAREKAQKKEKKEEREREKKEKEQMRNKERLERSSTSGSPSGPLVGTGRKDSRPVPVDSPQSSTATLLGNEEKKEKEKPLQRLILEHVSLSLGGAAIGGSPSMPIPSAFQRDGPSPRSNGGSSIGTPKRVKKGVRIHTLVFPCVLA
jgi:hypothetical protein